MTRHWYLRTLLAATTVLALAGIGGGAYALTDSTAVNVTGPDHTRLTVTLAPGSSYTFNLPKANDPVKVDLDKVSTNGALQTPSELFSALVNVDKNGAGMSWIGTNSDGTQNGSSTIAGTDIANLVCGSGCVIASLNVASVANHTVVLSANAATSDINETYVINIWY